MAKRNNKLVVQIVSLFFLINILWLFFTPEKTEAQTDLSQLVYQAVVNNQQAFNEGKNLDAYDAFILTQAGIDVDTWVYEGESFKASILSAIDETIAQADAKTTDWSGKEVYEKSSKTIAQQYLAAKAWNEEERAALLLGILKNRQLENNNGSIDNSPFADIAAYELIGRSGDIAELATGATITFILDNRDSGTGAWTSSWNDFMTTAQAIRALSYLQDYAGDQSDKVQEAIDAGLNWLLGFQKEDGSFAMDLDDPAIDTPELIYTLLLLEIDPSTLEKSPIDYLTQKALNDDGTFGTSKNIMDNTWVLDAYLQLGGSIGKFLDVIVNPQNIIMKVNETKQLTAIASKLMGSQEDVTSSASWSTEDPHIASVDNTGLLTALSEGSTVVKAVYEGVWGTANITVQGSNSSPGVEQPKSITVNIAVVGREGNLLYGPGTVIISSDDEFGLTAMSALDATGLSWEFSEKWEGCIHSIAGEANEGMNGWMFSVNGSNPPDIPQNIKVSDGATIIFWYSTEAMGQGPKWSDIISGKLSHQTINQNNNEEIEEILNSYNDELTDLLTTKTLNENKKMALKDIEKLREELNAHKVDLSQEIGKTKAVIADIEVSMLIPENALSQSTNITIKELAANKMPNQEGIKLGSSVYQFGPKGTKFNKPVTIAIKVPLAEDLDISHLTPAWYDEELQEWIPIPGIIDLESGLAIFKVDHFTYFAVIEAKKTPAVIEPVRITFDDVNSDIAWAKDAIELLAGKGIINGTGGEKFEPNRLISRAEFVRLLVSAQQLEAIAYQEGLFSDIDASDWFANYVATAYHNKVVWGYPDGSFRPYHNISRNEVASIFYNLGGTDSSDLALTFNDVNEIPEWAINGVSYVYSQGLMVGYADNSFKGNNPLTRAEAAVVIFKYLEANN